MAHFEMQENPDDFLATDTIIIQSFYYKYFIFKCELSKT
jgi:hypothetical protein